jgi:alkylation response protein AidB-like acyl-CoA dehydrogenase
MQDSKDNRSLGELFAELARESSTLVHQEIELAKAEMTTKASRAAKDIGFLAIGGFVAYAGLLGILAAVIIGLAAAGLPWWLSALLVGLVVVGVGYMLVQKGLSALKHEDLAPRQTIESIKEDTRWAKEQVR